MSDFNVNVCARCGCAVHPPLLLCPRCASPDWRAETAAAGTVEELTEADGTRLASVRTDLGPRVIARAAPDLQPGDRVALSRAGGVAVARRGARPRRQVQRPMGTEPPPRLAEILRRFGLGDDDLAAWEESGLQADDFEDWLTDRVARQPAGRRAREVYGADDIHDFARRAILDALALGPQDRLLDVGCGGGLLLRDALASGATVTGLDHSEDMARLARERAPGADVVLGSAEQLPFADASFTAIAMSIVFFFLPDPIAVLRECRRVLAPGGRLAVYTTSPALRGTPAAPEPVASRGHFYEDEELADLAHQAGLAGAAVVNDDGGQLLTASAPM
jgi:SAM-dependent methyltransferase